MTAGQRAMARAFAHPEPENKGGRGKKNPTETVGFSPQRLSYARTILRNAPLTAEAVLAGEKDFDAAYAEVQAQLRADKAEKEKLEGLRSMASDLADKVADGELHVDFFDRVGCCYNPGASIMGERFDAIPD